MDEADSISDPFPVRTNVIVAALVGDRRAPEAEGRGGVAAVLIAVAGDNVDEQGFLLRREHDVRASFELDEGTRKGVQAPSLDFDPFPQRVSDRKGAGVAEIARLELDVGVGLRQTHSPGTRGKEATREGW